MAISETVALGMQIAKTALQMAGDEAGLACCGNGLNGPASTRSRARDVICMT